MYASGRLHYDEAAATGILSHLSKEELEALLNDEDKLLSYIEDQPMVKNFKEQKDTQQAVNRNLAEFNLSKEPTFREGKEQLAKLYNQAVELQKDHNRHKGRLQELSSQQSADTTLALLQTETAKSEEEAENIADSFLEGNLDCEDFVNQYTDIRTTSHLRRVKSEKMTELIRVMSNQRPGTLPPITPKNPPNPTWGASGAAPYPAYDAMPNPQAYMGYR